MPRGTSVLASAAGAILAVILGVTAGWMVTSDARASIQPEADSSALYDTTAPGVTPPADCLVADEPTPGGPAAPSDLAAGLALPSKPGGGKTEITWTDNSDNETCFVLEVSLTEPPPREYTIVAILPPSTTFYTDGPYPEGKDIYYRVYASTSSSRSGYSNEDSVEIPFVDPTFTPSPSPSFTPTPTPTAQPTQSQSPSPTSTTPPPPSPTPPIASGTPSVTPAQLPSTGGHASSDGSASALPGYAIAITVLTLITAGWLLSKRRAGQ